MVYACSIHIVSIIRYNMQSGHFSEPRIEDSILFDINEQTLV